MSSAAWFSHGSPVGIARRWSTTGILVREDRFADDGDRCGDQRSWHDSGQPRSLIGYDAGRLDGRCQVWLASGTLVRDGRFCAGRIDGEWRQFAPDGRLLGSFAMRHGNGEYREWHDRGQIRRQGRYRDGKMHGQWTQRSSTGEMLGVLPFQDGSGTFRSWRDDGVVAIEGVLLAGGRVGSWSYATTGGEHEHIDFGKELAGDRVDPWLDPVAPP